MSNFGLFLLEIRFRNPRLTEKEKKGRSSTIGNYSDVRLLSKNGLCQQVTLYIHETTSVPRILCLAQKKSSVWACRRILEANMST